MRTIAVKVGTSEGVLAQATYAPAIMGKLRRDTGQQDEDAKG
jgi:hypothetical protein